MHNYCYDQKKPINHHYANNINMLLEAGHEVYLVYPVPRSDTDVKKITQFGMSY